MKKEQTLTDKIFRIELLSGTIFYGIGLLLVTPPTTPLFIKYIAIGGLIIIEIAILIRALIIKSEKIDERAKNNFSKSSNITLFILIILLIIWGMSIQLFSINMAFSSGFISLTLATILTIHACAFKQLEMPYK